LVIARDSDVSLLPGIQLIKGFISGFSIFSEGFDRRRDDLVWPNEIDSNFGFGWSGYLSPTYTKN